MELDSVEYYVRLVFLYYFMGQIFFDQRFYLEVLEFFVRVVEMNFDNIGYYIRRYQYNKWFFMKSKVRGYKVFQVKYLKI